MKHYTAVAAGANRVKVFDIKTGVTSYHINLESKAEITNVQCPGNSIAVTFKDGCGRIKTNVYNDISKGILSYSNVVGNYDIPRPATQQVTPQAIPQQNFFTSKAISSAPSFAKTEAREPDASYVYNQDSYTDDTYDDDSTFDISDIIYQLELERRNRPFWVKIKEDWLNPFLSNAGGLCSYILLVLMCCALGKKFPYSGQTFLQLLIWLTMVVCFSWLITRGSYKLLTKALTIWITAPLVMYITYCYFIH